MLLYFTIHYHIHVFGQQQTLAKAQLHRKWIATYFVDSQVKDDHIQSNVTNHLQIDGASFMIRLCFSA